MFELGTLDAAPVQPRRSGDVAAAGWTAPGVALAGTGLVALAGDACGVGFALPASGLALTVVGAVLWIAGLPRVRRDRITLSIGVATRAALDGGAPAAAGLHARPRTGMLTADLLQTCGLALLLVTLALVIDRRGRDRTAAAALLEERRRLARELHDGVAQELAYIRSQSRRMAGGEKLVEAADRALDESRAAISALVRANDEPLARSVEAAAISIGERHGIDVICDLSPDVEADAPTRDALLRILREAISNAARHGGATSVRVQLRPGPRLSVTDDGRGFDPSGTFRPDALGLDEHAGAHRGAGRALRAAVPARVRDLRRGGAAVTRVVLADDHLPSRAGVCGVLKADGITVCADVGSAELAVAAVLQHRPDACLLEVTLPGDGIAAAEEIALRAPGVAVIMLTVATDDASLFAALRAGARGYLVKDTDPDRLPHAVRGVLAGEAAVPRGMMARVLDEFCARDVRRRARVRRVAVRARVGGHGAARERAADTRCRRPPRDQRGDGAPACLGGHAEAPRAGP